MPLELVVPSLDISIVTHMSNDQSLQKQFIELLEREEDQLILGHS
jgi:hypothetical protein